MSQPILHEITHARRLFESYGEELLEDPEVAGLLAEYRNAIGRSGKLMELTGIHRACASCAVEGPGSCCYEGIEAGYDRVLLLINLLFGCAIPDAHEVSESCLFVGARGCKLPARYYFCIHYLCPALHEALESHHMKELVRTVAEELHAGWELEQALRVWVKRKEGM